MLPRHLSDFSSSGAEKSPEDASLVRHPWELTLREFIDLVWRNYGIHADYPAAASLAGLLLSKDRKAFPVVVLDEDEILSLPLLRSICRLYRVPAEDFGLPSEEGDDE